MFVANPKTGRSVKVGSSTYNKLVKAGDIEDVLANMSISTPASVESKTEPEPEPEAKLDGGVSMTNITRSTDIIAKNKSKFKGLNKKQTKKLVRELLDLKCKTKAKKESSSESSSDSDNY